MCLNKVTWQGEPKNPKRTLKAWKVLEPDAGHIAGVRFPHRSVQAEVHLGRWMTATRLTIGRRKARYDSGFHVVTTRAGARKYAKRHSLYGAVIVRVEVQGVRTKGTQYNVDTWVCDRMRIPRNAAITAVRKAAARG